MDWLALFAMLIFLVVLWYSTIIYRVLNIFINMEEQRLITNYEIKLHIDQLWASLENLGLSAMIREKAEAQVQKELEAAFSQSFVAPQGVNIGGANSCGAPAPKKSAVAVASK
jgi:hypothetical protein